MNAVSHNSDLPKDVTSSGYDVTSADVDAESLYDYNGAVLYVVAVLTLYSVSILLFIVSMIRKTEMEDSVTSYLGNLASIRLEERRQMKNQMRLVIGRELAAFGASSKYHASGFPASRPTPQDAGSPPEDSGDLSGDRESHRNMSLVCADGIAVPLLAPSTTINVGQLTPEVPEASWESGTGNDGRLNSERPESFVDIWEDEEEVSSSRNNGHDPDVSCLPLRTVLEILEED